MYFCWNRGWDGKLTPSKRDEIIRSTDNKVYPTIAYYYKISGRIAELPLYALVRIYPNPEVNRGVQIR